MEGSVCSLFKVLYWNLLAEMNKYYNIITDLQAEISNPRPLECSKPLYRDVNRTNLSRQETKISL
jgi:hypothetical protein